MTEKAETKKAKQATDPIDELEITPELLARLRAADQSAEEKETGAPTSRGRRRLKAANRDVAERDAVGPSTYQAATLKSLEEAVEIGFLGGQDSLLLSQMANEVIRAELDISTLPPKVAAYVQKLIAQKRNSI
ncbi:MAG: hypothetical protein ACOYT9_02215 [Patescibacteria group bacterium]